MFIQIMWQEEWESNFPINGNLIKDVPSVQPGSSLPRRLWNRICKGQSRYNYLADAQVMIKDVTADTQTMHIVSVGAENDQL